MKMYIATVLAVLGVLLILFYVSRWPQTIRYQDSNANGLWDDLESFIDHNASTEVQRKALEFRFKEFQNVLLDPEIGLRVKNGEIVDGFEQARACLNKVWGGYDKAPHPDKIKEVILHSPARVKAWITYNSNLSGGVYSLWSEEKDGNPCPFNEL